MNKLKAYLIVGGVLAFIIGIIIVALTVLIHLLPFILIGMAVLFIISLFARSSVKYSVNGNVKKPKVRKGGVEVVSEDQYVDKHIKFKNNPEVIDAEIIEDK